MPGPVAVTLYTADVPGHLLLRFDGCTDIVAAWPTFSVAALETACGEQVPLTTHLNWFPSWVAAGVVMEMVDVVTLVKGAPLVRLLNDNPPSVLRCHW